MFRLQNDRPRPKPWTGDPAPKTRQRVLFAGMDCLPDQLDLFATDGADVAQLDDAHDTPGSPGSARERRPERKIQC